MPDNDPDVLRTLYNGVITAQMIAMSAQHIVRELIIDVARLHPDPERYIRDLYGRSISHVDRMTPLDGTPEKEVNWQARDILGAVFRNALTTLRTPPLDNPRTDGSQP